MRKLLIFPLLIICFLFIGQKAEAKIWSKDLVDKVTLNSGYKFSLCSIDMKYDRAGQADNILSVQEKDFEANPNNYPCNKQSQEDILFANITLFFNKTNGGVSESDKLIEFQNKLYSLNNFGSVFDPDFVGNKYSDLAAFDWFSDMPGIHALRVSQLINTDPSAKGGFIPNSTIFVLYDLISGKYSSALFALDGTTYKVLNIISRVTVPTTLVDYTEQQGTIAPSPSIQTSNTPIPTIIPTTIPTVIPTATPKPTPIPLGISLHILDLKTGNPVPNDGNRINISGEGINKTIENQAEAYFPLTTPGTYEVTSSIPSGYWPNETYCSDNSKCFASGSGPCDTRVELSQGKIDIFCTYNKGGPAK